jgi:hypothetical protein
MPDLGGLINGLTTMLISLAFGGINGSLIVAEAPRTARDFRNAARSVNARHRRRLDGGARLIETGSG